MNKRLLAPALVLALAGGPAAMAEPVSGLYVGVGAGYNAPRNVTIPTSTWAQVKTNGGLAAIGQIGWGFGNGLRIEAEGSYRTIPASGVTGYRDRPGAGSMNTAGLMVNALYDLDLGVRWVTPYAGVGVGAAWTTLANMTIFTITNQLETATGTQIRPAAQGILGTSFPIDAVPGLSLTTEYRIFAALGSTHYASRLSPANVKGTLTLGPSLSQSVTLGARYAFNAPAPAPKAEPRPVPAAAPARSYLVFFDWDKATLTDRARAVIKEAADNAHKVQVTRIEVSGYTDTSGTAAHNMALSIRRAQAVAAELVKNGVARNAITAQGFGDTKLLVATGPGVREPQNRRVEIVLK